MKSSAAILFYVVVIFLLTGCGDPRIDASTEETMKASTEQIRAKLSESKRPDFDRALQTVIISQLDLSDILVGGVHGAAGLESKIRQSLDGKTADDVITEAARISAERAARERQQALEEISELKQKRQAVTAARVELAKFEILRSRFFFRQREFIGQEPVIELTVRNGTLSAVSHAYFLGTIASPGRSVPWLQESFNYAISGGLEPGETATWRLAPNMFSEWGQVMAPADAIFTVIVERLDGPNGEALYSTRDFDEEDARRLAELKIKFGIQ